MALEDLIGGLYQFNMGLPLQYANPNFSFLNNQAGNMTSLGNQYQGNMGSLGGQAIGGSASLGNSAMGLYGNLAGQQASMYQSELPMQMEMQKYNSLAPALSGLLGQFGGGGMGGMNISPINMNFNRPDVMSGYQGAVNNAYKNFGNTTNQAYGQATDAYGRAHSDTAEIGNQFQGQWQNLQDRVFPTSAIWALHLTTRPSRGFRTARLGAITTRRTDRRTTSTSWLAVALGSKRAWMPKTSVTRCWALA
jgi:hypothetical protein